MKQRIEERATLTACGRIAIGCAAQSRRRRASKRRDLRLVKAGWEISQKGDSTYSAATQLCGRAIQRDGRREE